jgi:hypothetical protein
VTTETPAPAGPSTPPPGAGEVPTHRRQVELDVFESEGGFRVVGRLRDDRPWAAGTDLVEHVHDMVLEVTVRREDLTITAARAEMRRFPHHECRDIEQAFEGLVGLSVARGYTRAVQARFGRTLGCAHLELLARLVGPAVIQAIPSSTLRQQGNEAAAALLAGSGGSWLSDTCHVWRSDGPGPQKLAIGWRPGSSSYPAPPLAELRREHGDGP